MDKSLTMPSRVPSFSAAEGVVQEGRKESVTK